jgi:hypothetical protein
MKFYKGKRTLAVLLATFFVMSVFATSALAGQPDGPYKAHPNDRTGYPAEESKHVQHDQSHNHDCGHWAWVWDRGHWEWKGSHQHGHWVWVWDKGHWKWISEKCRR